MDTEEALIEAALANWEERDVKLRLADFLREQGENERADLVTLIADFKWEFREGTRRDGAAECNLCFGSESYALAAIFDQSDGKRWAICATTTKFYTGTFNTLEEARSAVERFYLTGKGIFLEVPLGALCEYGRSPDPSLL